MRCILHIGTEKTGSTSIQKFLLRNQKALQASGVHVCTSAGEGNNRALAAAFMSDNKKDDYINQHKFEHANARQRWKEALCEAIATEVLQARRSANVFLISSEHFHSRLQKAGEVMALHTFLSPLFDEIKVFCYLRRQDQMAVSRYSQSLKAGLTPGALLPLNVVRQGQGVRRDFDFRALLDRCARVFLPFDVIRQGRDIPP